MINRQRLVLIIRIRDYTQVVLGSDEGYLYKAEIFSQNSNSDQSLSIKESINAHYGPITSVQFFPIHRYSKNYAFKDNVSGLVLYLTSSYDWTVKLWQQKQQNNNKAISIFDQMKKCHPLFSFFIVILYV
eukprot:228583_1